jgi:hypothetical protein
MRADLQNSRSPASGLIVPTIEIEAYLAAGFRLADEPGCDLARLSVCCGHRVQINMKNHALPGKKIARPRWRREPGRNDLDNALDSRNMGRAQ